MYIRLVTNKLLILSLPLFLAASLLLPLYIVPLAHASPGTGLVCITASTSATSCPSSPATIGPLTPGSSFTVGVFIQDSDAMGGFDIFVASNPAFVSPVSAALGALIVSPSLTSICVNGSAQTGSCTVGSANGAGVVEVTTIESSGANECGGISPCSGMAFTITYTVVAATPTTSLSYPTAPGCSASSVSSPPNVCVEVADSTGTVLPENIQGATVNIVLPQGVVCIIYPVTATSCPLGRPQIPVTYGSTLTVGVFDQGVQPIAGFDIYVMVDSHYLHPINASLGTLIPSPSLTVRCVNGQSFEGACTPNSANGPDVVEVSTIDASGSNVCLTTPCSGLKFTITYQVVGVTPSTPIDFATNPACATSSVSSPSNVCVLEEDAFGTPIPVSTQGADVIQSPRPLDPTRIDKICVPNPVVVGQPAICTVEVNDVAPSGRVPPIGEVTWSSAGFGNYNPDRCTLSPVNASASECSVIYLPLGVGTGIHPISVIYAGDTIHSGSTDPFNLVIARATPSIATEIIVDQTGQPYNSTTGVPFGLPVHDIVILLGGYPVTGATGSVTYTVYPNGACTAGTGTVVSTVPVTAADNVANSASVMKPVGRNSFDAAYTPDVNNNNAVRSTCEPFTVTPSPHFARAHWTHHLSLSKTSNTQSWTVVVDNPLSTSVKVVVRIVGQSTTDPSHTFDVTCGVTCVNTASGGVNSTPGLTPVTVAAGASSFSFSFSQPITSTFVNQKVTFTATGYWAIGTLYTHTDSKSGAFAVVP